MIKRKYVTGKNLQKFAFVLGSAAVLSASAHAQTIVSSFTFETSLAVGGSTTAATVGPLLAETGIGSASGVHTASTTVYSSPAGNGSAKALSSNTWATGDYYQFTINTVSYVDLTVAFDMSRSGTGPSEFNLLYSSDGGTTFQDFSAGIEITLSGAGFSTGAVATSAGLRFSFDFSAINSLENNTGAIFRIVSDGLNSTGGTVAAGGTARVDNFIVTSVPEPSSLALVSVAAVGALGLRRRRKTA